MSTEAASEHKRALPSRAVAPPRRGELAAVAARRAPAEVRAQDPAAAVEVARQMGTICPQATITTAGQSIQATCNVSSPGCDCVCDATSDSGRAYDIFLLPATASTKSETMHDGTTQTIPDSSLWPNTVGGDHPTIEHLDSRGSSIEFGFFQADGRGSWYRPWRILAHELCGHGRLRESYSGDTGDRPGHDTTIDTENAIATNLGQPARGHFSDRRQGEAFYNPVGNRSRVAFKQTDGWHYEAPIEAPVQRCACGGIVGPEGECAECRAKRLAAEAPPDVEHDDECGLYARGDVEQPYEDAATIVCDGKGDYRVSPGWSATATCGIGGCVQAHEESHAADWRRRWPNGCKKADGTPKPDGADIPLGGAGYAAFLKKSECTAYTGEVPCGERLLAAATKECKPVVEAQLKVWRARKASYCK